MGNFKECSGCVSAFCSVHRECVQGVRTNGTLGVGQLVRKKSGYAWPGEIVAVFKTRAGKTRVVVECTVEEVEGALHIYSPEQIEVRHAD